MGEDDTPRRIKVVDRRWFTEDGELRPDRPREPQPTADAGSPPASADPAPKGGRDVPPAPDPAPTGGREVPPAPDPAPAASTSRDFLELIATLAQQAELFLAGAEGFPRQPEQAKRLIDYLGVLESKTRGNLSVEESQVLSNIVFQLRTLYVQSGG